jgi:hypothetical protein
MAGPPVARYALQIAVTGPLNSPRFARASFQAMQDGREGTIEVKRRRQTPDQIVRKLREAHGLLGRGDPPFPEVCKGPWTSPSRPATAGERSSARRWPTTVSA